jgi:ligand-binding sensor domain-containing protein
MKRLLTPGSLGLLLLLSVSSAASAESPGIHFEQLSLRDGLSQVTILSIHEDPQGHLWFGTEDGLNRYDGSSFTVYRHDPSDPSSLPADYVRAITEDAAGRLWLGTEGGGVARWDSLTDRFVRYREARDSAAPRLASDYVQTLLTDRQGAIWIGLRDSGLQRLDPMSGRSRHFRHHPTDSRSLVANQITALAEGRDGSLWVGTSVGLDRFDPESGSFFHYRHDPANPDSLADITVRALFVDRSGTLWIGTQSRGMDRFDPETQSFTHYRHDARVSSSLGDDHVRAILEDARGRLWVGTLGGLDLLDRETGVFFHLGEELTAADLGATGVLSLHQDREGILWVGTRHEGLVRWDERIPSFAHHRLATSEKSQAKNSDIVTTFAEDTNGRIFIGTFGAGLARGDRSAREVRTRWSMPSVPTTRVASG